MASISIESLLQFAAKRGASDLHIKVNKTAIFRRYGELVMHPSAEIVTTAAIDRFLDKTLNPEQRSSLKTQGSVDLSYDNRDGNRFRIHAYANRGTISLAARVIPSGTLNLEELKLPAAVKTISQAQRGLILVTGASGSGKSTTVAAILDHMNHTRSAHIVTIEDPIEFVFVDDHSIFSQREVGLDSPGFAPALRASLRQDPDVILVGEIRDYETVKTALHAAETGHLVISTLHTIDAVETVQRITAMFPGDERDMARNILASVLHAVVSQRLVPRCDEKGRVAAIEILVANELVRDLLRNSERESEIRDVITGGGTGYGMQSFDQSLMSHFEAGYISYDEALRQSSNPSDFALLVSGISGTSTKTWKG